MIPLQLSRTLAFGLRWPFRSNAVIANPPNPFLKVSHPSPAAVGSASAMILRHTTTCGCRRTATTATSALNLNMSCFDGPGGEGGGETWIPGGFVVGSAQHRQGWWRSRRRLAERISRERLHSGSSSTTSRRTLLPFSLVSLSSKRGTSTSTTTSAAAAHAAGAAAGAPQQGGFDGGSQQEQQEQNNGEGELGEAIGGSPGGDDDLIASLVDEFVWKGDGGEEEEEEGEEDDEEEEWQDLDGLDLTKLGIEFMVSHLLLFPGVLVLLPGMLTPPLIRLAFGK